MSDAPVRPPDRPDPPEGEGAAIHGAPGCDRVPESHAVVEELQRVMMELKHMCLRD